MIKTPCIEQCPGIAYHHTGLMGKNYDSKRIMFVLHRPDERVNQQDLLSSDYEGALLGMKTGHILFGMLKYCGLSLDDVFLTNLLKCVFQRNTDKEDYQRCKRVLEGQVLMLEPSRIVAFGSEVRGVLSPDTGNDEYLGRYPILFMEHPSRIWAYRNRQRVEKEYERVREFLGRLETI